MNVSTSELTRARNAAERLLESLGLDAYLYEVEPGENDAWTLILECATGDGWQRLSWAVDKSELLRSLDENPVRERLAEALSRRVAARGQANPELG